MKHSLFLKLLMVVAALSTGMMVTSCKKEDFSLCDQSPEGPYQKGRAQAKAENDVDYAKGFEATKLLGYEDGKAQALSDAYQRGFTEGYNQGYDDRYWAGENAGERDGEDDGYRDGKRNGYNDGMSKGESDGYADGYKDGYRRNSCRDERKVKPTDEKCFNKGYTEVRNAQASYNDGYAAGLLVNPEYQKGYKEWQNDVATITLGRADGFPVGQVDGYNDGYAEGYDEGYEAEYRRGYNFGWDEGYGRGYDLGYDRGYADGRNDSDNDSCLNPGKDPIASFRKSASYKQLLNVELMASTNAGYKDRPATVNKLLAGIHLKPNSLKGMVSKISPAHVQVLRTQAATRSWNRHHMGDVSSLIPPGSVYRFSK